MTGTTAGQTAKATLSVVLQALAHDESRGRISVGDLLAAMGDRALAALLFVFAVPNVLPGTSAILGAPLVFLAAQLAFGRRPRLTAVIARRTMTRADSAGLVRRIGPWLARAERLLRPRVVRLALPPMEYLAGLAAAAVSAVIVSGVVFAMVKAGLYFFVEVLR